MTRLIAWLAGEDGQRLPWRAYAALAILALVLFLPGQASIPPVDRDEARFAQATRQMFLSGDFIDIRFGEEKRHVQPVGIYWLQVVTTAPFGGSQAPIFATRLPSMLSAVFAVLLTAWFAARIAGSVTGLAAGTILAMTFLLNYEAQIAKIDATLMLATLIGEIALFEILVRQHARGPFIGWPAVFWAALGVGVLLKGPIILIPLATTVLCFALWRRDLSILPRLRPLIGLVLAGAIFLPWVAAITLQTNGAFLSEAVGHSFAGKVARNDDSHGQPFGYHLALVGLTFFPSIVLLGLGAVRAWRGRGDPQTQFLIAWIVPTWLIFELVVTKLPHYTLPVFPALAVLAALGLKDAAAIISAPAGRWAHRAGGLLFLIAAGAFALVPVVAMRELHEPVTALTQAATIAGLAVIASGAFLWWRPAEERLLPLAVALAAYYGLMFEGVIAHTQKLFPSAAVARLVSGLEGCEEIAVATAGYREPSNIYHFGMSTLMRDGPDAAAALAAGPECTLAVVDHSERDSFIAALAKDGVTPLALGRVEGRNISNGRDLDLEIFAAPATRLRAAPR